MPPIITYDSIAEHTDAYNTHRFKMRTINSSEGVCGVSFLFFNLVLVKFLSILHSFCWTLLCNCFAFSFCSLYVFFSRTQKLFKKISPKFLVIVEAKINKNQFSPNESVAWSTTLLSSLILADATQFQRLLPQVTQFAREVKLSEEDLNNQYAGTDELPPHNLLISFRVFYQAFFDYLQWIGENDIQKAERINDALSRCWTQMLIALFWKVTFYLLAYDVALFAIQNGDFVQSIILLASSILVDFMQKR